MSASFALTFIKLLRLLSESNKINVGRAICASIRAAFSSRPTNNPNGLPALSNIRIGFGLYPGTVLD